MNSQDPAQKGAGGPDRSGNARAGAAVSVVESGAEPSVQSTPVPVLLVAMLVCLVYWGSMYILEFGGEADARVHSPYTSFKQIDELQPKSGDEMQKVKGALVYARICATCHQADGGGSPAVNAPPLTGSEWVEAKDPSRIIRIVLYGLSGPIEVKGKEWGAGQMLSWKDILTDDDIANVLTYIRNSWGNKAPPVNPEQAKKVRAETAGYPTYMTVPDLMKVLLKE